MGVYSSQEGSDHREWLRLPSRGTAWEDGGGGRWETKPPWHISPIQGTTTSHEGDGDRGGQWLRLQVSSVPWVSKYVPGAVQHLDNLQQGSSYPCLMHKEINTERVRNWSKGFQRIPSKPRF